MDEQTSEARVLEPVQLDQIGHSANSDSYSDNSCSDIETSAPRAQVLVPPTQLPKLPASLDYQLHVKRLFDIVVASTLLVALSPVLIVLYAIISLEGGSPVFSHSRIGKNGRKFGCLKFRSMVTNASEFLQELLENDPAARAEWEKDFKLKNDPRITKVGRFLRQTSLDELPQLFNVLKGEMSLVGPRPIVDSEIEYYGDKYIFFRSVTPGITGLWQISGRNDVSYESRVELDETYARNWSIWLDLKILIYTVPVLLLGSRGGAY